MKKLLLTALFAIVSTAFVTAQNYYVGVQNCTSIGQEFRIEIMTNDGNCVQTGQVINQIAANSFNYFLIQPISANLGPNNEIAWGASTAQCPGEISTEGYSPAIDCTNLNNVTGNAQCIGNYDLTVIPQGYIFAICASGVYNTPVGSIIGYIDIQ